MTDFNLFSFVESFSTELSTLANRIEDQLFEQPHATLMQSRLFSEQLVRLVSDEEEIEKVYPLKHSERIHKLYRNNAIEEDIYMKLEWLRKKGNSAAHSIKEIEIEDVLKAHKFLYDISVWYMQVYVSYDFEAPIYKLPIATKQKTVEIEDKVDGLIKPYLDETLKKIDNMWSEINQELQAIKKEKEQISQNVKDSEPVENNGDSIETHFSLIDYLEENRLEYIDKRDKKGALWVIGDWSISEMLFPLKAYKIYFRYSKKGGRTTEYRPAWFLLNKTLPEIPAKAREQDVVTDKEKSITNEDATVETIKAEQVKPSIPLVNIVPTTSEFWKIDGQIMFPAHLLNAKLEKWPLEGINILAKEAKLERFRDLTEEILRELYRSSQSDFNKVLLDLYWLGCRFNGNLRRFQPGQSDVPEEKIMISDENSLTIDSILPRHLSTRLVGKLVISVRDLNSILVSSIEFLFKEDAAYVLQLIQDRTNSTQCQTTLDEKETLNLQAAESDEEATSRAQITYRGETLIITGTPAKLPLSELGIEGCTNLINRIRKLGIYKLEDIKKPIDNIHLQLPQVGPATVEKFWNQLQRFNKKSDLNPEGEIQQDNDSLILNGTNIKINEEVKNVKIKPSDFPGLESAVNTIIESGMTSFGQLPIDFSELGHLRGIGKTRLERLFQRIKIVLDEIQEEQEINQLPDDERLQFELNAYQEWFKRVSESEEETKIERIQPRYLEIVKDRYRASLNGEHLTLEMLGEKAGVTRERIRQILAQGNHRVCQRWAIIIELLEKQLKLNGGIILEDFFEKAGAPRYLMWTAFESKNIYAAKIGETKILTLKDPHSLEKYITDIQLEIENVFALHIVTKKDLIAFSQTRSMEDEVDASIIYLIADEVIYWLSEEQGVLRNLKKIDAFEMVMLQFPNGVEVYKREQELIEKANDILPGSFLGERAITSMVGRDNIADRIVLWGRGIYIHTKFITDDKDWVLSIQDLVECLLQKEDFIHVSRLYRDIEAEAKKRNIPNEYALYSLLRRYPKSTLSFTRFPTITLDGVERQANSEWIIQYIKEQGRPVTTEELVDVFVNTRGWRRFTLEQNLFRMNEIIPYEHGTYTLISNYDHIQKEELSFIISSIEQQLEDKSLIFINAVFEENEPILKSFGIETSHVLYGVLKEKGQVKAKFPRYPYIVSNDYNSDSLSVRKLIETIIKAENTIVAREEVNQWIEELFGYNDRILDLALIQSDDILYYSKGQYGEYIHRDTINMHDEMEQKVQDIVRARYEEIRMRSKREYVLLEELYTPTSLPMLNAKIPWSKELLGDILKKSELWTLIGSYDEILLPIEASITDGIAFIDYILTKHFGGAVKMSQLEAYLAEIRYSSQGNLLMDVTDAIASGTAPYSIMGDELIHHKLNGGKKDE